MLSNLNIHFKYVTISGLLCVHMELLDHKKVIQFMQWFLVEWKRSYKLFFIVSHWIFFHFTNLKSDIGGFRWLQMSYLSSSSSLYSSRWYKKKHFCNRRRNSIGKKQSAEKIGRKLDLPLNEIQSKIGHEK